MTELMRPSRLAVRRSPRLCFLALLTFVAGCAQPPPAPLRIGINAWPGYEFIYLAQEKGFYRDEGLEVRVVEFSSLADCRRAFERGQIDALGATVVEVLQASDQSDRTPQIIQIVDSSHGADVIIAQPGITNAEGLRGRKIGVELASVGVYVLARGLETIGLGLGDVTAVSMDQTSMEAAFRRGELDAMVTYPPFSIKLQRDRLANTLFSSAEIPGEVLDVIAADARVIGQRPRDIERLVRAYQKAIRYAQEHPAEAHSIMARREGITPQEFSASLTDGIRILPPTDQSLYLKADGKLSKVIDRTDRILRQAKQINGVDRRAQVISPTLVTTASPGP